MNKRLRIEKFAFFTVPLGKLLMVSARVGSNEGKEKRISPFKNPFPLAILK